MKTFTIIVQLMIFSTLIFFLFRRYILQKRKLGILKEYLSKQDNQFAVFAEEDKQFKEQLRAISKEINKGIECKNLNLIKENQKLLEVSAYKKSQVCLFVTDLKASHLFFDIALRKKHPSLTENDIKYCILLKAGLSIKESSKILGVSTNSVKMGRNRAKHKMGLRRKESLKTYVDNMKGMILE